MNPFFSRFKSFLIKIAQIVFVVFAVGSLVSTSLNITTPPKLTAPVILDGRPLFEVSQSRYSAQKRANDANRVLKEEILTSEPPIRVEIDQGKDLPVILVDGKYLLSVTSSDAPAGLTVEEQAQNWAEQLRQAIAQAQRERTGAYLSRAALITIGYLLLAFSASYGLEWLWYRWLEPLLYLRLVSSQNFQNTHQRRSAEVGTKILLTLARGVIWLLSLIFISRLFPQTRELSRKVSELLQSSANLLKISLTSGLVPLGGKSYSVLDLLILIGLFVSLVFIARTLRRLLRSRVLSLTGLNRSAQETISQIANYTFIFIGTIVVLQLWGLDISSLAVFASVLGVGIGLGLQGIAKEFVSGLVLIFERPIQIGDFVNVGDLMGTVERIGVRSTEIRTLDDISIIIPNSRFLEAEVINWTHQSPVSRIQVPVGVAYGSNLNAVRAALIDAAKEHSEVLAQPAPQVFFKGFGDSSLDFDLLVWIAQPYKQFRIKSDLYFRIETMLRDREIEIPFPQRDLHVRSGNLPVEISPELVESISVLSQSLAKWLEIQSNISSRDSAANGKPDQEQSSKY
ncbi:mechanosensitive ion channel domain-containing protein [Lyngbya aestuarii]|uniref:mechanosensitive ion channel domain-containing protein n=1 Tax=Lyngbya aestuarii TaxID=118322 RepID=UPI00403DEDC0